MREEHYNDLILWTMLQNGNKRGVELIYQQYYLLMLNYGLKLHSDRDAVKDAIQDVFVKLQLSKNISTPISPRSYLLKALKNTLYDKINANSKLLPLEDRMFNIVERKSDLLEEFSRDDESLDKINKIYSAYSKLNLNQQQIIYLRYFKEFSFNEIADVLDVNRQSAMNLTQRTLVKLRSLMTSILNILAV